MKFEVTRKGVYDQDGERVPVGTVINVKGDDIPAYLLNKARPVIEAKRGRPAAVTNPATDNGEPVVSEPPQGE